MPVSTICGVLIQYQSASCCMCLTLAQEILRELKRLHTVASLVHTASQKGWAVRSLVHAPAEPQCLACVRSAGNLFLENWRNRGLKSEKQSVWADFSRHMPEIVPIQVSSTSSRYTGHLSVWALRGFSLELRHPQWSLSYIR